MRPWLRSDTQQPSGLEGLRYRLTDSERIFGYSMQAEDGYAARGANVYPSIGDDRGDEFVAAEIVLAAGGLRGVVEFVGKIGCVVSV
jgi:hypothetical protein